MEKDYLSRLWYGFLVNEKEIFFSGDKRDVFSVSKWLASFADEHCSIGIQYHYDEQAVFVYVKESLEVCEAADQWAKPIQIPIPNKCHIPINGEYVSMTEWDRWLMEFCEARKITYKQPSWHLTIEHW